MSATEGKLSGGDFDGDGLEDLYVCQAGGLQALERAVERDPENGRALGLLRQLGRR